MHDSLVLNQPSISRKENNMAKTYKDYPTVFQITKIEEDRYILLGVFTKKQMETLMQGLQEDYAERATGWRGQYQALAKAIVAAYEGMKE
jgi:hypothetical protein